MVDELEHPTLGGGGVRTASGCLQGNLLFKTCFERSSCGVAERDHKAHYVSLKIKKPGIIFVVASPRLELGTQGSSGLCSTN